VHENTDNPQIPVIDYEMDKYNTIMTHSTCLFHVTSIITSMAWNGLLCADVSLRNYSLTHLFQVKSRETHTSSGNELVSINVSCHTSGQANSGMGKRLRAGTQPPRSTQPGHPSRVGTMSTSEFR